MLFAPLALAVLFFSLCEAELVPTTWGDLRSKVEDLTIVFVDSNSTDQEQAAVIDALSKDSTVYQVDRQDPANAEIFNNTFFSTDLPRLVTVVEDEMRAEYLEDAPFTLENCREFIRLRFAPTNVSDVVLYEGQAHISPRDALNETEAAAFHARSDAEDGPLVYLFVSEKNCKTCPFFVNAYLRFAGRHRGQAKFYIVNCDENARFCFDRAIQRVPTIKLLDHDLLTACPVDTMIGMDKWLAEQLDPSQENAAARRAEHEELIKTLDEMEEEYDLRKKELAEEERRKASDRSGGSHEDHDHTQDVMQQLTTPTRQKVIALERRVQELEDIVARLESKASKAGAGSNVVGKAKKAAKAFWEKVKPGKGDKVEL